MVAPYEKDKPLLEQLASKAFAEAEEGDAEALGSRFAENCTIMLPSGEALSKRGFLAAIANGSLRISAIQQQAVDVRISFDGQQAQITGNLHADAQAFGTPFPAAGLHVELTAEKQQSAWRIADLRIAHEGA